MPSPASWQDLPSSPFWDTCPRSLGSLLTRWQKQVRPNKDPFSFTVCLGALRSTPSRWKASEGLTVRDKDVCSAGQGEGRGETHSCCANFEQHQVMSNKGLSKEQAGSPAPLHPLLQDPSCPSCKSPGRSPPWCRSPGLSSPPSPPAQCCHPLFTLLSFASPRAGPGFCGVPPGHDNAPPFSILVFPVLLHAVNLGPGQPGKDRAHRASRGVQAARGLRGPSSPLCAVCLYGDHRYGSDR